MPGLRELRCGAAFAQAGVSSTWDEARSLISRNYNETGLPELKFAPNRKKYVAMEGLGLLRLFTMRSPKEGELWGYQLFVVSEHLHYPDVVWAMQDTMFVRAGHRGRRAVAFLVWADKMLASFGVDIVYRHVASVDYSRTLERLGYAAVERKYMKRLR